MVAAVFCGTSQAAITTNFGNYGGSYTVDGNKVTFTCKMSPTGTVGTHSTVRDTMPSLRLTICTPSIVRVEYDPTGRFTPYASNLVGDALCDWGTSHLCPELSNDFLASDFNRKQWPLVAFTHSDSSSAVIIETSSLRLRVTKTPLRVQYFRKTDNSLLLAEDTQNPIACTINDNNLNTGAMAFRRTDTEHLFGWSMPWWAQFDDSYWNLFEITNRVGGQLSYTFEPIFYSSLGYGVFAFCLKLDTRNPIRITFGGSTGRPYFAGQPNDMLSTQYMTYYFINGPQVSNILDGYTQITGRPPLMNKKYYGIQKVLFREYERYGSDIMAFLPVFKNYVDKHRQTGHHLDIATLDCWTSQWRRAGQTNMEALAPGMTEMLNYGKTNKVIMGAQTTIWCINDSNHYDGNPQIQTVSRAAIAIDHGFSFAWYDEMGTHSYQQSKTMWDTWKAAYKTRGLDTSMTFVKYGWHNMLGHAMPAGTDGDWLNCGPGGTENQPAWCPRGFTSTLVHALGASYYNTTDFGESKWNVVSTVLRPAIAFHTEGRAGCTPYSGGGQYGYFNSIWDTAGNTYKAELSRIFKKQYNFRYRMIPYLFTYGCRASQTGMPIWRPMFFHNLNDPSMYPLKIQSYVGEELIQAAYYEGVPDCAAGGIRNNIKLPAGTWYDWWGGTRYDGPTTVNGYQCGTTPETMRLPLFVKAGAIIPLMPEMTYIGQMPEDPITLAIWPIGSSSFELWEDEKGVRSTFTCVQTATQTTVGIPAFSGSVYSPATRKYVLEVHASTKPQKVVRMSDMTTLAELASLSALNTATSGWYFDQSLGGICHVKPAVDNTKNEQVALSYNGQVVNAINAAFGVSRIKVRAARSPLTNEYQVTVTGPGSVGVRAFSPAGRMVASIRGMQSVSLALPNGLFVVQVMTGDKVYSTQMMRGE